MNEAGTVVSVVVRARLRGDPSSAKALHDQVTGATKEVARQAGDISHRVFVDPRDPTAFLGIDTWQSAGQAMAFAADPRIADFFGKLFDGPPEVTIWVESDWNQW
jgi:quinol monooxygenase YgiN